MKRSDVPMLKAILFDLDNTLLDFMKFKKESARAAAKAIIHSGLRESESVLYSKIFAIYDSKGIEYQRTFHDLLSEYSLSPHQLEHMKQAAIIAYTKKKYSLLRPQPKVVRTLSSLKSSYKLGIVTDAPRDKAWQRLVLSGLDLFFYPVVTFNDTHEEKPSVNPFKRALSLLKVRPDEALFVGDNTRKDIIGAKKVGIMTCLAKYGCLNYVPEEDVADYKIERFEELKRVVKDVEE